MTPVAVEARETVGPGIRPIQVGQGEPVQYGEAHDRAEESTCQERRDEQQAQDRASREAELRLNTNGDFFEQYVLGIRGNDNIKTMKVRIVQQVFPQLGTLRAQRRRLDLTLYKNVTSSFPATNHLTRRRFLHGFGLKAIDVARVVCN